MKVIVAMKGHPGTGKSTLARSIASSLKIPLIDKDDVRDCTFSLQQQQQQQQPSPSLLNDLSYNVIHQIASTQLRLGLSVIIDSPLSRRSHLDRLFHLASSTGARLLVIECKPSDEAVWRSRLEQRGSGATGEASWHKPATWQDLERLMDGYGGCTDYDVGGNVAKLVLDTSAAHVGIQELASMALDFIISHTHLSSCTHCNLIKL